MFTTHVRGGKAFATEQKMREFKKRPFKTKTIGKILRNKRLRPNKSILKATKIINSMRSGKYDLEQETIEKKNLEDEASRMELNFYRLIKVK